MMAIFYIINADSGEDWRFLRLPPYPPVGEMVKAFHEVKDWLHGVTVSGRSGAFFSLLG